MANKYDKYDHLPPLVECLFEYDCAALSHLRYDQVFTVAFGHLPKGPIYYCHRIDDDKWGFSVFAAIEVSADQVHSLKENELDIRSLFTVGRDLGRPVLLMNDDGSYHPASDEQWAEMDDLLPVPGVYLYEPKSFEARKNSAAGEPTA